MKSLSSVSVELLNAICWSSFLLRIFITKKWVEFILTSFGYLKYDYDCVIKTIEMFNFVPLINNSVTTGFSFLILIISATYH